MKGRGHSWICGSSPLVAVCCLWILVLVLVPVASHAQESTEMVEQTEQLATDSSNRRAKFPENTDRESTDMVDDIDDVIEGVRKAVPTEGFFDAFVTSLSIILVSEIGDETFIIAALMAMRHPRAIVLSGALSALVIMTVLSTGLGRIVPNLISRKHTNAAATVLYTFFGARLLYIAWRADPNNTAQKELEEVEEKLEEGSKKKSNFRRFLARLLTPIFLEAFILTFLAEWGDRSQIATIAEEVLVQLSKTVDPMVIIGLGNWKQLSCQELASHKNAVGVTIGAAIGHSICTSVAVVGGRLLALRISQRTVATIGGLLFLCFAVSSYIYPPL